MDMELIRRWNDVVDPGDTVIHLGDFCFNRKDKDHDYYREQLNGDLILVKGNHDARKEAPIQSLVLHYGGVDWRCEHYPMRRYKHNLCGHVHSLWRTRKTGMGVVVNMSVDVWDFTPASMDDIFEVAKNAPLGESR